MDQDSSRDTSKTLGQIVRSGDAERLAEFLHRLPSQETAWVLSRLGTDLQSALFALLKPEQAARVLAEVPDAQAIGLIEDLSPEDAGRIVDELRSDYRADLLAEMKTEEAEAIIQELPPENAEDTRKLLVYPPDTAGGIMITEYLSYSDASTVAEILDDLQRHARKYSDYDVQYAYITSEEGVLVGVLPLRDLLFASPEAAVKGVMIRSPRRISTDASLQELQQVFDDHPFFGIPVVAEADKLVGVVRRASVKEALNKSSSRAFLKFSGIVGGEEFRSMPTLHRSFRRVSWLSVNIVLNLIAASVIAFYQDTLAQVIALAVFLPIISDMSGCSGNQAVAVSMRELALGLVKPREFRHVFMKEAVVGILNGILLGAMLALVATWFAKGNLFFGLVVGSALALNTLLSVTLGGMLPLIMRRLKLDPALVSSPILTTVTDMCGFFLVLSFATVILPRIAV